MIVKDATLRISLCAWLFVSVRGHGLLHAAHFGLAAIQHVDPDFCVEAFEEAITLYGKPEIFNTDRGSHFTDADFVDVLKHHNIRISMDGKGAWRDNVFIERFWKTNKYEEVYLHAYEAGSDARDGLAAYIAYYNHERPHSSLDGRTPEMVYFNRPHSVAA